MFEKILEIVKNSSKESFEQTCRKIETCINFGKNFIAALRQIAIIPEAISHDSSEEKLFSKASDMLLARAFRELSLKSIVLRERGDSADIIAESKYFNYTLVNEFIAEFLRIDSKIFDESLKSQILAIIKRAEIEKTFWLDEIQRIKNYSRKQAINELIKSRKIQEKLSHIETFIESIRQ